MTELLYLYNIGLIILYTVTLALSLHHTFTDHTSKKHQHMYFILALYLLFFLCDNLIISMTEIIPSFGITYNQTYMGIPIVKTIIFLVNNTCQIWLVRSLRHESLLSFDMILLALTFIWMLIPFSQSTPLRVFLYYLPNQLLLLYMGYIASKNKSSSLSTTAQHLLTSITYLAGISSLLIILEDAFVIFQVDSYQLAHLSIQNRSFSEDLFSVGACCLVIWYLYHQENTSAIIEQELHPFTTSSVLSPSSPTFSFFEHYHLTEREKEICTLLLQYKHNQEIAEELYLSVGTVKTHIHNIFQKMDIHKREQIFAVYKDFQHSNG